MPRPTSDKLTTELLDQFLTYDPKTGELRTRATGKLLDPVRPTKINGIGVHPARAAYAMGNLGIWDKVGFKDGNPRNLKLDNLIRAKVNPYIKSGKPRKPRVVKRQGPSVYTALRGMETLATMAPGPVQAWSERLDAPTPDTLPHHPTWTNFLRRHFTYDPDKGTLASTATGRPLQVLDGCGQIRSIPIPRFELLPKGAPSRTIRIDRLVWLLATERLPEPETTRLDPHGDIRATSVYWHPDGVPRAEPKLTVRPAFGGWVASVYHNNRTTKVEGVHAIEEEAHDLGTAAAERLLTQWRAGLVLLADYQPTPTPAPAPRAATVAPPLVLPAILTQGHWDDEEDETEDKWIEDDAAMRGPITTEPRKPWVYTPIDIDLD